MRGGLAIALALMLGACSGDEPKKSRPAGPTGFTPEEPRTGAAILLRARAADGDRRTIDVVARGVQQPIHGTAFRLAWDPAKAGFVAARASDVWSKQATLLAKEGLPGELVVVWTETGAGNPGVSVNDETVLGSIDLVARAAEDADVGFRTDRCTLRDANGSPVTVDWQGGRMTGR